VAQTGQPLGMGETLSMGSESIALPPEADIGTQREVWR